jgi:hypothetical protein
LDLGVSLGFGDVVGQVGGDSLVGIEAYEAHLTIGCVHVGRLYFAFLALGAVPPYSLYEGLHKEARGRPRRVPAKVLGSIFSNANRLDFDGERGRAIRFRDDTGCSSPITDKPILAGYASFAGPVINYVDVRCHLRGGMLPA